MKWTVLGVVLLACMVMGDPVLVQPKPVEVDTTLVNQPIQQPLPLSSQVHKPIERLRQQPIVAANKPVDAINKPFDATFTQQHQLVSSSDSMSGEADEEAQELPIKDQLVHDPLLVDQQQKLLQGDDASETEGRRWGRGGWGRGWGRGWGGRWGGWGGFGGFGGWGSPFWGGYGGWGSPYWGGYYGGFPGAFIIV